MNFRQAVISCLRRYFTFSGRSMRSEYWWFVLFLLLAGTVSGLIDNAIYGDELIETHVIDAETYATVETTGLFEAAFWLLTFLPMLAVGWRRMHDTGRSGLCLLYPLIAMVGVTAFATMAGVMAGMLPGPDVPAADPGGFVVAVTILAVIVLVLSPFLVLWWLTRPSQPGPNQYGPNPHEVAQ